MTDFYQEMMLRNWAFITPKEQEKIKNTTIFLAGCGLGSNVALLALETGFTKFILADYDKVEISNLNRQVFDKRHLGKNKALALKDILEEKSDAVKVEAYSGKVTSKNAKEFIDKADIIINTVDFNEVMYKINDLAIAQKKLVLSPLNIGWIHGYVLAFTSESSILEDIIGGRIVDSEEKVFTGLMRGIKNYEFPPYFLENFESIMQEREKRGYNPQLGTGSMAVGCVVVIMMVKYLSGASIRLAPDAVSIDNLFNA